MRRLAHFSVPALAVLAVWVAVAQQPKVVRDGDRWRREFYGVAPAGKRLRINAHGPVTLQAGTGTQFTYSVSVRVRARSEAEAALVLQRYAPKLEINGGRVVLTAPGGPIISTVTVKTPRLEMATISTSDGAVEATGVDGSLEVDTGAGELNVDRIKGDCKLVTGGGLARVGNIGGSLFLHTGAGNVDVGTVHGQAIIETEGGDIFANEIGGPARVETGGGSIHIVKAGGEVNA